MGCSGIPSFNIYCAGCWGHRSDRTQFLASRSPQSTGGDRQVSRQCQSRVPEWESMELWEHRKAPNQPEVREAFLQEETPQLG